MDVGVMNNTAVKNGSGSSYILDDFVVPPDTTWTVTGLFTHNVTDYPFTTAPFTQAVWSIRTGVSFQSYGRVLYSGISHAVITRTGRDDARWTEYEVRVMGLSLILGPGTYFMAVSPLTDQLPTYYVAATHGANSVGTAGPDGIYSEYEQSSPPNHWMSGMPTGTAPMGVIGVADLQPVPALTGAGSVLLVAALAVVALVVIEAHHA